MAKHVALIFVLFLCANFIQAQILPTKIKSYLNKSYKGWKLSPSGKDCGSETNNGIVKGNFNADKILDYAVKFTQGEKGFIIAFLAQNRNYKAFVLHDTDAEDVSNLSLGVWKKGGRFELGEQNVFVRYDAPSDFRCESDVGGIHLYRNGKFIAY